jgi:hypothetical protein
MLIRPSRIAAILLRVALGAGAGRAVAQDGGEDGAAVDDGAAAGGSDDETESSAAPAAPAAPEDAAPLGAEPDEGDGAASGVDATPVDDADAQAPSDGAPAGDGLRYVEVEWGAVDGAAGYQIELSRMRDGERDGDPVLMRTATNKWSQRVAPGRYVLRARSVDEREAPGQWSEGIPFVVAFPAVPTTAPAADAVVDAKRGKTGSVALAWKSLGAKMSYLVEVVAADARGDDPDPIAKKTVRGTKTKLKLPVAAAYKWRVRPVDAGEPIGESPKAWPAFTLRAASLAAPTLEEGYEPDAPTVEWTRPEHAETFKVTLSVRPARGGKWKKLVERGGVKDTELTIKRSWPLGRYRLQVVAEAALRKPSRPLTYAFTRDLSEDKRILRPLLFLRAGLAPTYLRTTTTGIEPEPDVRALIFSAYDLLGRWALRKVAVEVGYSLRRTILFEGGADGGGDVAQPPLHYDASRAYGALTYFLPIGGSLAIEPFLGIARRAYVLLTPTAERTLAIENQLAVAILAGGDLTVRLNDDLGLRGRASYEQLYSRSPGVRSARFIAAEGTLVRSLGKSGFTLAGGYSLSIGTVGILDTETGASGRMREQQHALLAALAFAY